MTSPRIFTAQRRPISWIAVTLLCFSLFSSLYLSHANAQNSQPENTGFVEVFEVSGLLDEVLSDVLSKALDEVQVDDGEDLKEYAQKLEAAGRNVIQQEDTVCCYARSDKAWVADPQGIPWETFLSIGEEAVYGSGKIKRSALIDGEDDMPSTVPEDQCCTPTLPASTKCCVDGSDKTT